MSRGLKFHPILYLLFFPVHGPAQTGSSDPVEHGEPADWMALVQENRKARDDFLRNSKDSPLPVQLRPGFKGLDYFPLDPRFRLVGDLQIYGKRRKIQVPTNAGSLVPMERFGRLVARMEGMSFPLGGLSQPGRGRTPRPVQGFNQRQARPIRVADTCV